MQFFNTLSRKKEEFKPIKEGHVSMYSCGPTVYDYAHLGNLRAFVFVDLLKKFLKYKGFKVKHVMNITDVDDKTIRNSKEQKKSLKEFTRFYEKEFLQDLKTLNIGIPDIMPRATEHIKEMVHMIEHLKKEGFAYEKDNATYFSIEKSKDYGQLALLDLQTLKKNADGRLDDSDEYEKDNARDFVLWKKDDDVSWKSSLGQGRPGWHIECSAMSTKYLGDNFDIHTGGIDLIFPHHTNEIAQCTDKKFVNYWIHNAHLIINGEKMSKSKGNFFTLRDLLKKKYDPLAIRYELLATHYRQQMDFREKDLESVKNTLKKFKELFITLENVKGQGHKKVTKLVEDVKYDFEASLDDDLNIAGALAAIYSFIREIHKISEQLSKEQAEEIKETLLKFNDVLGVMTVEKTDIPHEIKRLAEQRQKAREQKDWQKSDELRAIIKQKGYSIDDTKEGYIIKKI